MENNEVIRWSSDIPKHGDPYWYIDGCYDVAKKTHWKNSKMDRVRYRANMLFFTEEQANAYCELFWHSRNPSRIGTDGKVWEYTIGKGWRKVSGKNKGLEYGGRKVNILCTNYMKKGDGYMEYRGRLIEEAYKHGILQNFF